MNDVTAFGSFSRRQFVFVLKYDSAREVRCLEAEVVYSRFFFFSGISVLNVTHIVQCSSDADK